MSIDLKRFEVRSDMVVEDVNNQNTIKKNIYNHTSVSKIILETPNYGKKEGIYYTIETKALDNHDHDELKELQKVISDTLIDLFKYKNIDISKKALIIGLGNPNITPDALGPVVVDNVLVTRHIFLLEEKLSEGIRNVSMLKPGVMGQTGIETFDIIMGVINKTKPDFLIVIDALASKSIDRLCKSIQITDAGINPGSGVGNNRKELSYATTNIPVIAIGVPMVLDAITVANDLLLKLENSLEEKISKENIFGELSKLNDIDRKKLLYEILHDNHNLFLCPKDIDSYLENLKQVLSNAINTSLHPIYLK